MKRPAAIIFAVFYLLGSFGVGVNMHYCSGKLEFIEIIANTWDCCCGDEDEIVDCCHDETFIIRVDREKPQNTRVIPVQYANALSEAGNAVKGLATQTENGGFRFFDPPPPLKQPAWLLHCSLTYYG